MAAAGRLSPDTAALIARLQAENARLEAEKAEDAARIARLQNNQALNNGTATPMFPSVIAEARRLAERTLSDILDTLGGVASLGWSTCPTRDAVTIKRECYWRSTQQVKVTDRLLANLNQPKSPRLERLGKYLEDQTTNNAVIIYGTTGAGKTRLLLEYLSTHWGHYLPTTKSFQTDNGASNKLLMEEALAALDAGPVPADEAMLYAIIPIACRVLVLDRLRDSFPDVQPHQWLFLQLQGSVSHLFVHLWRALSNLHHAYHVWVQVISACMAKFADDTAPCICVDEAQFLLTKPIIPTRNLPPGAPGRRTAYGTVVRAIKSADLQAVMAGTGMSALEACLESTDTGCADDRERHDRPQVLTINTMLNTESTMEYIQSVLEEYEAVKRDDIRSTLRSCIVKWFNAARPRFVVRLVDELEILFKHDGFVRASRQQQCQAVRDVSATVVWFVTKSLVNYFQRRNDLCGAVSLTTLELLAQRVAVFQFAAATTVVTKWTESGLHEMVERGFMSLCDDGLMKEPLAARAFAEWIGATKHSVALLKSEMKRRPKGSPRGYVFESLVCASICAQFREAAKKRAVELAWNVDECPMVPVRHVPWVSELFPDMCSEFSDVRLLGVGKSNRLVVTSASVEGTNRNDSGNKLNVGHFLLEPSAPFFFPSTSAGPDIVFKVEFANGQGRRREVHVLLQCKLTPASAIQTKAWYTVVPTYLYMSNRSTETNDETKTSNDDAKACEWLRNQQCVGAIVSFPKRVPNIPDELITHMEGVNSTSFQNTLRLIPIGKDSLRRVMTGTNLDAFDQPTRCGCKKRCSDRRCGCKRKKEFCGASCACNPPDSTRSPKCCNRSVTSPRSATPPAKKRRT